MNQKNVSIWIASIILISNSPIFAQEKGSHEIAAGYSIATANYIANSTAGILGSVFSLGLIQIENIHLLCNYMGGRTKRIQKILEFPATIMFTFTLLIIMLYFSLTTGALQDMGKNLVKK